VSKMDSESYFDGGLLSYVGHTLLAALIVFFTIGIATPWAVCFMQRWKAEHTVIDGKRLYFDGTASQLFGNWIKWLLLSIVTIGIYSFWLNIKMQQWVTKHTHHA
jgi:uncharacterized membrane protein YjgN (DUF898 family)